MDALALIGPDTNLVNDFLGYLGNAAVLAAIAAFFSFVLAQRLLLAMLCLTQKSGHPPTCCLLARRRP